MDYRDREQKLKIFGEIVRATASGDSLDTIAHLILDLAMSYTKAEKGSIMSVGKGGELRTVASRGLDVHRAGTYRSHIGEDIAGFVAQQRTALLVTDISSDDRFRDMARAHYKTRSFVSCPIVSRGRLLAVLNMTDKEDGTPFTEDEFEIIKIIADQTAMALDNAALLQDQRARTAELEELNRKLIESDLMKSETLTRISHELRTPLNAIKGAVYHLSEAKQIPRMEQEEFLGMIAGEADRLVLAVDSMLDYLAFEDETRLIKRTVIDIAGLLSDLERSQMLKSVLSAKNIHLSLDVPEALSTIAGDKQKTLQLFYNLLRGLSAHLEPGDTVRIVVQEDAAIEVDISCPRPLPENVAERLFKARPFFVTSPEQSHNFYLAKKIADVHRWGMSAQNTDTGFVASLRIPKREQEKRNAMLDTTMGMFIEFIADLLDLNVCSLMLTDHVTGELTIRSARGLDEDVVKQTRIRVGDRIAGWVALEGKPLLIENIETDPLFRKKNVSQYTSGSFLSVPLKVNGHVLGVLNLSSKRTSDPFTQRDLDVASVLGERVSRYIEKLMAGDYNDEDLKRSVNSFTTLVEAERHYHKKGDLIPRLVVRIMKAVGASEKDRHHALFASLIYDLGLSLMDTSILNKDDKLSPSEQRSLRIHPFTTLNLLDAFEFSEEVKRAVLHHHENYDGTGYPEGLKGEDIPLIARVLAVVDAFSAMTEGRPYRAAVAEDEAYGEIEAQAGTRYDPLIVDALGEALADSVTQT